jgi:pimeloyl-ACP methyl ester carboxylesterase
VDHTTDSFTFAGHQLVYDTYGSGDRLLVYLHGLLVDSEMNRGVARALAAEGHRVVLLDLLGHGRSDKPAHASEYRIDTYAEQVFALLDHLGADEAVLGGLSLGANVSLLAATERPERVRGLVLEMPVLEWAVPSAALLFAPTLLGVHYLRPFFRVTSAVGRRMPRTPFGSLNSALDALSLPPDTLAAVLHGVLVGPVAPTTDDRRNVLVPALILAHRHDLIHPFNDAVNLAEQLPTSELQRARSPLELRLRPRRLTGSVAAFLDRVWSSEVGSDGPVGRGREGRGSSPKVGPRDHEVGEPAND